MAAQAINTLRTAPARSIVEAFKDYNQCQFQSSLQPNWQGAGKILTDGDFAIAFPGGNSALVVTKRIGTILGEIAPVGWRRCVNQIRHHDVFLTARLPFTVTSALVVNALSDDIPMNH